jgi:hypothetical protein
MARVLPVDLRDKEGQFVMDYTNTLNLTALETKIHKETGHLDIMRDFKITKHLREAIWDTDEEIKRTTLFRRLLPSGNYLNYRKFFSSESQINLFLCLRELDKEGQVIKKNSLMNINKNKIH